MKNHPSVPAATYRIQFHKDFPFAQGRELASYLNDLGVSHLYASPIFRATPGSLHGYDICDHNEINPELGCREDFNEMAAALSGHGLEIMLDFVPNHMGIAESTNGWWMDVLENGPFSPYARFFDINWQPIMQALKDKVLLPILGDQYGRVLESGDLKLGFDEGSFHLDYGDRRLPLAPRSTRPVLELSADRFRTAGRAVPAELESIVFALDHLPSRRKDDGEQVITRAREKSVIKARLARLCSEDPVVEAEIRAALDEIQSGGTERNFDLFDALLSAQHYRLSYWRVASEDINFRRFFDINTLAAIRMELPEVFDATHQLVFELLSMPMVTGLRIDHVDGLWDPRGYFDTLQKRYAEIHGAAADDKTLYLLVEKILAKDERLRRDWPVHGTTGYEFGAQAINVLVDAGAEKALTETYRRFVTLTPTYAETAYQGKLLTMRSAMASEVNALAHMLNRISETHRWYRDFTLNSLTATIREVIACFPVYRTYITPQGEISHEDSRILLRAIASARRKNPALERSVFDFIRDIFMPPSPNPHPVDEDLRLQFILKLQQCTGAITAKGVEDTAYYVYNRFVALNEVGGDPGVFGTSVEKFHEQTRARAAQFPHSLLATSTHDTKRSEDVRARLAALSELPKEWTRLSRRWHHTNRKLRREIEEDFAPDASEEYLLYQTLVGTWPLAPMSPGERADYIKRIQAYMVKALHEAKVNSSWVEPNSAWDNAVGDFVARLLEPGPKNGFLSSFEPFAQRIAELGAINSLAQTVLKLTVPGVPDIYQGQELWDFSLVDPDNRRPVDYEARRTVLGELKKAASAPQLLANWRDGRIKFLVTHRLLQVRRNNPRLFLDGSYDALAVEGALASHVVAFSRTYEGNSILVMVPRLSSRIGSPPVGDCWRDTQVQFVPTPGYRNVFTGAALAEGSSVKLAEALREFPVAVYASPNLALPSIPEAG